MQFNHYDAPRAATQPLIDGVEDQQWEHAPWQKIDVLWLGAQQNYPSAEDFTGHYKAMWDSQYLYLLVEIVDDVIFDNHRDPLSPNFYIDDTVELFIDEDASGGNHSNNNAANAWSYHISTHKEVVDFGLSGELVRFDDHFDVEILSNGTRYIWEMKIKIYGDDYDMSAGATNTPLTLSEGKTMGFSASYIDNDNSIAESAFERESMMGSVDTQGHKDNLGYLDADVFGTMTLVDARY